MTLATATPTANAVPKADGTGKLAAGWLPTGTGIPAGGTTGQVLAKASATDGDVTWGAATSGGATFSHPSGNPVTLANGAETTITHPSAATHALIISIFEEISAAGALATATHTGYTSATGMASADSDGYSGNLYAWQALAGAFGWHNTTTVACYWQYVFNSAQTIASLELQCADGNGPAAFNLKGSNDGTNWTTLLAQSGLSWGASEQKSFTLTAVGSYTYYRLECTVAQWIYLTKINMITQGAVTHEACTIGNYASSQQFGVKQAAATTTKVKNLSGASKKVCINVLT